MPNNSLGVSLAVLILALSSAANASVNQDLTRQNFTASICTIDSLTVKFTIDVAFDEPLLTSSMKWTAGPGTGANCLSGITNIWVKAHTENGNVYVRLAPNVTPSKGDFGPTATESPDWNKLFCSAPDNSAQCLPAEKAKSLLAGNSLLFTSFDVTTFGQAPGLAPSPGAASPAAAVSPPAANKNSKLESMLKQAIDQAMAPTPPKKEPPKLTPEQIAQRQAAARKAEAQTAINNVVSIVASSLARFTTPAHSCSSSRVENNWVQAHGTCELNFRSETTHRFLCADDGKPRQVKATRTAKIDLAKDLKRIEPIRVSKAGWASMVLQFNKNLETTSQGDYRADRWQITATTDKLKDLEQLASSILTLKQYCEAQSASPAKPKTADKSAGGAPTLAIQPN